MKLLGLLCAVALGLIGCSNPLSAPYGAIVSVECEQAKGAGWATDVEDTDGWHSYVITSYTVVEACTSDESGDTTDPEILLRNDVNTVNVRSGTALLEGHVWTWDSASDLAAVLLREELDNLEDGSPPSVGDEVALIKRPGKPDERKVWGTLARADREALIPTISLSRDDAGGPLLDSDGAVVGTVVLDEDRVFGAPLHVLCQWLLDCSEVPCATWPDWP